MAEGIIPSALSQRAYDLFRRLPVARSIVGIHGSEREQVMALLPTIRPRSILLFDLGYPGYEPIAHLREHHKG